MPKFLYLKNTCIFEQKYYVRLRSLYNMYSKYSPLFLIIELITCKINACIFVTVL